MDYGQWSALCVLVGVVLVAGTSDAANDRGGWKRNLLYFGTGILIFGLVSCVLVAAGVSLSFS